MKTKATGRSNYKITENVKKFVQPPLHSPTLELKKVMPHMIKIEYIQPTCSE